MQLLKENSICNSPSLTLDHFSMFINKVLKKIKSTVTNYEFRLLTNRAKQYGYSLASERSPNHSERVIENFFGTNHSKNALLSYIIYPFTADITNGHSNNEECLAIAQILKDLGYNVDAINWDNTTYLPTKKYDLVIDNHNNLKRLAPYLQSNTTKIFHATNAHWLYQNQVEYARYYDFFLQKGTAILPPRLLPPGNSVEYCDLISMLGNDFTKSTYGKYGDKVHHIPISVTTVAEVIERDYPKAKKKFIWLNSHGALLKGLDVVIDSFAKLPGVELYIFGNLKSDSEFTETITRQLSQSLNIKMMGWMDINSDAFKKTASECAWVIGTSFSEGGGGSTLNCMAKGLIPVISKTSSLTLDENMCFCLEENNAVELTTLVEKISDLPEANLKAMSLNAYRFVASNHTIKNFTNKYKEFLIDATA